MRFYGQIKEITQLTSVKITKHPACDILRFLVPWRQKSMNNAG